MNEQIERYIKQYPAEIEDLFMALRQLIATSVSVPLEEQMWAKLPSYYAGENFVRLIPFKDHINIEASAAAGYREALAGYKMTPKSMVQIFVNQPIPYDVLARIFAETLSR